MNNNSSNININNNNKSRFYMNKSNEYNKSNNMSKYSD